MTTAMSAVVAVTVAVQKTVIIKTTYAVLSVGDLVHAILFRTNTLLDMSM